MFPQPARASEDVETVSPRPRSWAQALCGRLAPWLLALCWLSLTPSLAASQKPDPASAAATKVDSTSSHWDQVKSLLARGAYREAIHELDAILALKPNDPLALAYRSLCEKRLRGGGDFERLSPEELRALQQRLGQEQREQARAKKQQQALKWRIKQEQVQWYEEIKRYQEQEQRDEARKKRQQRRQRKQAREHPAPLVAQPAVQPAPSGESPAPAVAPASSPSQRSPETAPSEREEQPAAATQAGKPAASEAPPRPSQPVSRPEEPNPPQAGQLPAGGPASTTGAPRRAPAPSRRGSPRKSPKAQPQGASSSTSPSSSAAVTQTQPKPEHPLAPEPSAAPESTTHPQETGATGQTSRLPVEGTQPAPPEAGSSAPSASSGAPAQPSLVKGTEAGILAEQARVAEEATEAGTGPRAASEGLVADGSAGARRATAPEGAAAGGTGEQPGPRLAMEPGGEAGPEEAVEETEASSQTAWPAPAGASEVIQIFADQMSASPDRQLAHAKGHVRVVFKDAVVTADDLTLFTDTQDVYAQGHARLEQGENVFEGELVHVNPKTKKVRALEGTAIDPPWVEHGRIIESIAEGMTRVKSGYVTSCDFDPPHFRLQGPDVKVFAADRSARGRNVKLFVEDFPVAYFPWLSLTDRQSPFYIVPGKKKPWEQFVLMGYRYEYPAGHRGTLKLDWRRAFGWGVGLDHRFESAQLGHGLFKVYYNEEQNRRRHKSELPKGALQNRYRVLWRHNWQPLLGTSVVTDYQKYSDQDYRKELLFREEYVSDETPESFVSMTTNDPNFLLTALVKKRIHRFQAEIEELPTVTAAVASKQIPGTQLFVDSTTGIANLQSRAIHSDIDTDVVRLDWFQQLSYAMNWFRPILMTPKVGVRQTFYNKDKQGGEERTQGQRDLVSGQFSAGNDASLKLFRIFPVKTNALGLDINWLRHVLTPMVSYVYSHPPTVSNDLLSFPSAGGPVNQAGLGIENKLQTKRPIGKGKYQSVDLARFVIGVPYTFRGQSNKQGGRFGDFGFDLEMFPWKWIRLETDWSYPSHFLKGSRDSRITAWNVDLVVVGGSGELQAQRAHDIQAPAPRAFQPGLQTGLPLLPKGQWYLGYGNRYSYNSKTESVIQFDWRVSQKWQVGTFHRITWKEVAGAQKRFNNVRERQYTLTRDLHDWVAQFVYRVDREFGEDIFFTLTLKAYPDQPLQADTSYHQPKIGSQSSPFSPLTVQAR